MEAQQCVACLLAAHARAQRPDAERGRIASMAAVDEDAGWQDAFVTGFTDDEAWCFWQMWTRPSEYPHAQFHVAMEVGGRVVYVVGYYKVMNMGSRPSSKIACRKGERWLAKWRIDMDAIAAEWLSGRSPALRALLHARASALGSDDARPFWVDTFTDDYQFCFVSPTLAAKGAALWRCFYEQEGAHQNVQRRQARARHGDRLHWRA